MGAFGSSVSGSTSSAVGIGSSRSSSASTLAGSRLHISTSDSRQEISRFLIFLVLLSFHNVCKARCARIPHNSVRRFTVMIIIYGKNWNLSEPVGQISPPPFFICGILRAPAVKRMAAAAPEHSKKRRLTSPLFAGFYERKRKGSYRHAQPDGRRNFWSAASGHLPRRAVSRYGQL